MILKMKSGTELQLAYEWIYMLEMTHSVYNQKGADFRETVVIMVSEDRDLLDELSAYLKEEDPRDSYNIRRVRKASHWQDLA